MYDCLPMYHSVGGIVATGAMLVGGGSVRDRATDFRASQLLGRHRALATARCSSISANSAAICCNAPPHPQRDATHRLRLACGNGLRGDVWERFPGAFRHPAHPGVLRRHRRQRLALQRRGQARRHRPHAAVSGAPLSGWRWSSCDRGDRRACARCATGFCIACAAGRSRRGDRPDRAGGRRMAGRRSRATPTQAASDAESPARRLRHGRRLVPHRRPDAQGRARVSSISSTASATPSAGRARTSPPPRSRPCSRACPGVTDAVVYGVPRRARRAAPAWPPSPPTTGSVSMDWRRI